MYTGRKVIIAADLVMQLKIYPGKTSSNAYVSCFAAVNNACLVYDGKLVIDASFHTNDVAIRAAGPLTKFQRRYHADQWTHACFNSKEVGMAVSLSQSPLTVYTLQLY